MVVALKVELGRTVQCRVTRRGSSARAFSGLNVQLELPHIVYVLPKEHWKASDIRVEPVELNQPAHTLIVTVENRSSSFGRIGGLEIRGATHKVQGPGFPLFPGGRRRLELQWDADEAPDAVVVKSQDFSFERKLGTAPE